MVYRPDAGRFFRRLSCGSSLTGQVDHRLKALITDYVWTDRAVEREIMTEFGLELIAGPAKAGLFRISRVGCAAR
jgi:hypothetical protein